MRIKEVSAGYKGSKNYNSGEVSFTVEITEKEDVSETVSLLFNMARKAVNTKLGITPGVEDLKDQVTTEIEETKVEPKAEKKKKPLWMKCECKKNCKLGFKASDPDGYYCGTCKKVFY